MSTMLVRVPSLLRILCFATLICLGRGFTALPSQIPQSPGRVQARDALNRGVEAFKNGQTDEAIQLLEHAKGLDPRLLNARLYLGMALAAEYIPGVPAAENRQRAERAVAELKGALLMDPQNLAAIDAIGSLLFQMAGTPPVNRDLFEESKAFHERHIQIKPEDPEPYYWIGVINWTIAFRANRELRARYNETAGSEQLADADPLPPYLQVQFAEEWSETIDEGITNLKKALALRADYDDAMAYLNLLYRCKADAVGADFEREELNKMADDLIDKIREIKRKRSAPPADQP